jgi:hypothetical protein
MRDTFSALGGGFLAVVFAAPQISEDSRAEDQYVG